MANLPRPLKQHLYPDSRWPELDEVQPGSALEAIAQHYPDELLGPRGETLSIGEYVVVLAHGLGCREQEIAAMQFVSDEQQRMLTAELDAQTQQLHRDIVAFADDPAHRLDADATGLETAFAMGAAVMHDNDWRSSGDPYIAHAAMVGSLAQAAARQTGADLATSELYLTAGLWHDGAERFDTLSAKAEKDTGQRISRFAIEGATQNAALLATYRSSHDFYRAIAGDTPPLHQTPANAIGAMTKRIYLGYEKEPHAMCRHRFLQDDVGAVTKLGGDVVHNLADPKPADSVGADQEKITRVRQKYLRDLSLLGGGVGGHQSFDTAAHLAEAGKVMERSFDRYGLWLEQAATVECLHSLGASGVRLTRLPYSPEALKELQDRELSEAA